MLAGPPTNGVEGSGHPTKAPKGKGIWKETVDEEQVPLKQHVQVEEHEEEDEDEERELSRLEMWTGTISALPHNITQQHPIQQNTTHTPTTTTTTSHNTTHNTTTATHPTQQQM